MLEFKPTNFLKTLFSGLRISHSKSPKPLDYNLLVVKIQGLIHFFMKQRKNHKIVLALNCLYLFVCWCVVHVGVVFVLVSWCSRYCVFFMSSDVVLCVVSCCLVVSAVCSCCGGCKCCVINCVVVCCESRCCIVVCFSCCVCVVWCVVHVCCA